jgi:hypothetical protein
LVGPFKKAKGGFTHIFVAVDKFTKWVEAKPAASITAAKAVEFIKETMYRFVIPNNIITDNGKEQRSCRTLKWHDPSRLEAQNLRQIKALCSKVGQGIAISLVGPRHYSESCYGPHTIFFGLRV